MEILLYILFFAIFFGANIIKTVMEERERARSHEAAKQFGSRRARPQPSRQRKIGGYKVFGGEQEAFAQEPKKAEEIPHKETAEAFERELYGDFPRNQQSFYEEELARAQELIKEQNAAARQISKGAFPQVLPESRDACGFAAELVKKRSDLADAIILSEIIQPPLSMRRG